MIRCQVRTETFVSARVDQLAPSSCVVDPCAPDLPFFSGTKRPSIAITMMRNVKLSFMFPPFVVAAVDDRRICAALTERRYRIE